MALGLTLTIENEKTLPDGGPLSFRLTGARGADIGRDSHLDWTLPDPSRFISGKHCEIRFRDGGYWLSDVSTNGTILNKGDRRMQSPHQLRKGDRLTIGTYIIAVDIDGPGAVESVPQRAALPEPEDLWGSPGGAAAPADPRDFRPRSQSAPVRPDFMEWAVDVPNAPGVGFVARPAVAPAAFEPSPPEAPLDWMSGGLPAPPPPAPPPAVPTPRRSVWVGSGPAGQWDGERAAALTPSEPFSQNPPPSRSPPPLPPIEAGAGSSTPPGDVLRSFARGAGIPAETLATRDPNALAEHLGRLMRLVADNLKQLLAARSQTKRMTRSSQQTMIQALDNNPLKFTPSAAEALRILFGPPSGSYLDADRALQQSFDDLKTHQIKTFSAMQQALTMLIEDLDPKVLDKALARDGGLAAVIGSRKARLWDLYETAWKAKSKGRDGGLLELYLSYFAECYDRLPDGGSPPPRDRT